MNNQTDILLARDGAINYRNHARLGYDRIIRGVYARRTAATGTDPSPGRQSGADENRQSRAGSGRQNGADDGRRAQFRALAEAVVATYQGQVVLCGVSALQLLGVALPTALEDWDNVHVAVGPGACRPQRARVVAHQYRRAPQAWRTVDGLPVMHPVDCWLQLSGADDDSLIEVADGLMRRRHPLLSLDAMNQRLDTLRGTPGIKRARKLMAWVRPGTESIYETRSRLVLVHAGLPCPVVNCEAPCPNVGLTYRVDMGYRFEKVAVEYDGAVHVGDVDQMEFDAERRRHLQDAGWFIVPVTARQLRHPEDIVRSVEAALVLRRATAR